MIRSNSRCGKPHKNHAFISLADGGNFKIKKLKEKTKHNKAELVKILSSLDWC